MVDDVGFVFLPGAALVDGPGEIHAGLAERIQKRLVRSRE
jgi:hypothetical protein